MKKILLYILILFPLSQYKLDAQATISASKQTGCDTLTVKFTFNPSIAVTSQKWTFGDGAESTEESPQHKYSTSGKYLVSLKLNNNAADSVGYPDFILIGKTPKADFTFKDTLGFGSKYISFNPVAQPSSPFDYNFAWELSDGSTSNTSHFLHQFTADGNYDAQLIIADANGCADTVVKKVNVANRVSVPTVFTPNDDNVNDLFIIEGDGKMTLSIQIFTRSGLKVFESTAKVIVWDGRMFSGEKARDGIYYYVLESKDSPEKITQTGFVYIYTRLP